MSCVLFSPVGSSDPVRSMHDGPLLHIVRHYQPEAVYLFLSKEMEDHDRKDNRYEACVQKVAPQCAVHKIYSGIVEVHRMNQFLGVFSENLRQVRQEYPRHRLLLNITSGTAQINMALGVACLAAPVEVVGPGLLPVQVVTPARGANVTNSPEGADFDVDLQMEWNKDQREPDSPCRCLEEDLRLLRRNNAAQSILALCQGYQYAAALDLYQREEGLFPETLGQLLAHCAHRAGLRDKAARKLLANYQGQELFPVRQGSAGRAFEYFMVMELEHRQGELANFLVKMSPLLSYLAEYYLKEVVGYPLQRILGRKYGKGEGRDVLSPWKMREQDPDLLAHFETYFGGELRSTDLSLLNITLVLEYLCQQHPQGLKQQVKPEVVTLLRKLRSAEVYLRHKAAHEILAVTEEFFKRAVDENTEQVLYTSSKGVLKDVAKVMRLILADYAGALRFVYDDLNGMIAQEVFR